MMRTLLETTVADIMTTDLVTVNTDDNLHEVEAQLIKHGIHHLPVVKGDELVGMISQGDLLILKDWGTKLGLRRAEINNREIFRTHTASDIMSQGVISVKEHYTMKQLADLMENYRFNAFPVTRFGHLIGIVTTYDIVQKCLR